MTRIIYGDRMGKLGRLLVGCSAVIFDPTRQKVLLTRRTDNGRWCLPGGQMEAGESVLEACAREVREETGLQVRIVRLLGVYSNPHRLVEYADGNRYHVVALNFEAEAIAGDLTLSDETTEFGYFSPAEIVQMDIMDPHIERLVDAFAANPEVVVK
jgi:ADP-ribose pyrophosphatase YjhB (NUDIX family)